MNSHVKILSTVFCALFLTLGAASAQAVDVSVDIDSDSLFETDHGEVELEENKVIFHHEDKPEAIAWNDGRVRIGDQELDLSAEQRAIVSRYVEQLRNLRDRALDIAREATHFALDMVWNATVGMIFAGENADEKIDQRAESFEQKVAHEICEPIGKLHQLGNELTAAVPRLKPYLPEVKTESACLEDALED